jgi:hypothetical protein
MFWSLPRPAGALVMALLWAIVFGLASGRGPRKSWIAGNEPHQSRHQCCSHGIEPAAILPLDGGRIAVSLLPHSLAVPFARTERYGFFIVIALLVTGVLGIVIGPLGKAVMALIEAVTGVRLPGGF